MGLTYARLRRLLEYDPATGIFRWLVDGRNQYQNMGEVAGCLCTDGRVRIGIGGKQYLASRVAVLYMTGRWPIALVDHKNRNTADNRWRNLRQATCSQNIANSKMKNSNRLGFKGVVFCSGSYRARIKVNYRSVHLGRFNTAEKAHAAYVAAAKKYFGDFARAE